MTPAEADQERRQAAIRRAHRIDALEAGQLANFLHRMAAIVPGDVDRVLAEFDANAPKPRIEPKVHPVALYASDAGDQNQGIWIYCGVCTSGPVLHLPDGGSLTDLQQLVCEHSGITP